MTTLCVSGVTRVAFVPFGTARRGIAGGGILRSLYGEDIRPTADGVGVTGGAAGFTARFLLGVDGPESSPLAAGGASLDVFFLFLLMLASLGEGESFGNLTSVWASDKAALKRAERLEDILK